MTLPAFCPCCGTDIRQDEPILLNDFSMYGDGYPLCYKGRPITMPRMESAICWTLLKAYPVIVRVDAILNRIGSDGGKNTLEVLVLRIRRKLAEHNIPNPIEVVSGRGFRWTLDPDGAPIKGRGGGIRATLQTVTQTPFGNVGKATR